MTESSVIFTDVLRAIRRIIRGIDIHSKKLSSTSGVTGPQLVVLKEIQYHGRLTTTELAANICISQSTATTILERLEEKQLVVKTRDETDKRRWHLELSAEGIHVSNVLPFMLPESFIDSFKALPVWHQNQIIATLQHVAQMIDPS